MYFFFSWEAIFLLISCIVMTFTSLILVSLYLSSPFFYTDEKQRELTKPIHFSIIIPAYNEGENLVNTLDSLLNQQYPKDLYEIIVVDDGSTDNTLEVARRFEKYGVRVLTKKNGGAADAKNYGLKHARGDYIVTVDSDTTLPPDSLEKLARIFQDPTIKAVCGAARPLNNNGNLLEKFQYYEYDLIIFFRRVLQQADAIFVIPGAFAAFEKKVMVECGGYDPDSVTEDQEITFKIQKKGHKIVSPIDTVCYSVVPSTLKTLFLQRVRWIKGSLYNRWKHWGLFSFKYGDFVYFAYMSDIVFISLTTLFVLLWLKNMIITILVGQNPFYMIERVGIVNYLLLLPNPFVFANIILYPISIGWFWFAISTVRKACGDRPLRIREIPLILLQSLFFMLFYPIVWVVAIYQAIKGDIHGWATR